MRVRYSDPGQKCDVCHLPVADEDFIEVMGYEMHLGCASDIARALQSLSGNARTTKNLDDRFRTHDLEASSHLAFSYTAESEFGEVIAEFVRDGIDAGKIIMLVAPKGDVRRSTGYLKESGIALDGLIASGDVALVSIDTSSHAVPGSIVRTLSQMTRSLMTRARTRGMGGLDVLGLVAGELVRQGRLDECVLVERFWQDTISNSAKTDRSVTVMCPYKACPDLPIEHLQEIHDGFVFIPHPKEL